MRTTPAIISATQPPTAAALYTYRQAIIELQAKVDFSFVYTTLGEASEFILEDIPPDLATLTLYSSAETTDAEYRQQPALHAYINGVTNALCPFRYTYINGNGTHPAFFTEAQPTSTRLYVGAIKSQMAGSVPTTSEVTFGNWGVGSTDLCYSGHINNVWQNGLVGGSCAVPRPYTSITVFPAIGNFQPGSTFTVVGRYP